MIYFHDIHHAAYHFLMIKLSTSEGKGKVSLFQGKLCPNSNQGEYFPNKNDIVEALTKDSPMVERYSSKAFHWHIKLWPSEAEKKFHLVYCKRKNNHVGN